MSKSNKLDFHFVQLKGEITGADRQPATVSGHHSLSINRSSLNKLIATRESANTGDPLLSVQPPLVDEVAVTAERQSPIDTRALGVDFSLPSPETVDALAPQPIREIADSPPVIAAEEAVDVPAEAAPEEVPVAVIQEPESPPEPEPEPMIATEQPLDVEDMRNYSAELAMPAALPQQPGKAATEVPTDLPQPAATAAQDNDTDSVLCDVQSTLDSLADMAKGLTQQKLDAMKQQETLEQRRSQIQEKERLLADKDEQLRLLEARLTREVSSLERNAEDNARALAERSAALKALAENVEARDRNTAKLAETLRLEKQRNDELAESLSRRTDALDEREAALNRKNDELAEKLKQLIAAKDRFRALVKAFNDTVQFNNTLDAISSKALDDGQH